MFAGLPVWLLSLAMIGLVVVCVQAGVFVGNRVGSRLTKEEREKESSGTVVGALLGLLAFMLALTFSMASDRRESRKQLLLDEVNSIGTTYLRAGMIPPLQRNASRELLRKYVDLRIELATDQTKVQEVLAESTKIQNALWEHAETVAQTDLKNPDIAALYIESLNETIDLQTSRITVARYRIPGVVWTMFGALTALATFSVGYSLGHQSEKKHVLLTVLLSVSFTAVTFLILDLDHGNDGWLKVDQQPMADLRKQIDGEP